MNEIDVLYLLDLENVPRPSLDAVPLSAGVLAFLNPSIKKVPSEWLLASAELQGRFELIEIGEKLTRNSMDFHIAYHLGKWLSLRPKLRCVIVSGDTGFDGLISHLRAAGHQVSRAADIAGRKPAPPAAKSSPNQTPGNLIEQARKALAATPARCRPRTLQRLKNKLAGDLQRWLQPRAPSGPSVQMVLKGLLDRGFVKEEGGQLKYKG